ncbi:uncharacterized protein MYCGRDRAFT_97653 [Zymoseptoria tritici IPO323]|uniref:Uncharacterized protein n=1 Tax=Zymoseptoria tritici (strain CBS 115943 / IPO323) TaxID=336722 RepID=F9XQW4_ZYMTI|nr:uncharacterized protein MYCGRDRAFT_97653 [Zymoseptoria tritici IPO323]EGP82300.1 hypothetical protein MYCGRDRAFT_97653 [Zymoseptoria tritici IPO323]
MQLPHADSPPADSSRPHLYSPPSTQGLFLFLPTDMLLIVVTLPSPSSPPAPIAPDDDVARSTGTGYITHHHVADMDVMSMKIEECRQGDEVEVDEVRWGQIQVSILILDRACIILNLRICLLLEILFHLLLAP